LSHSPDQTQFTSSIDVTAGAPLTPRAPSQPVGPPEDLLREIRDLSGLVRELLHVSREQLELIRRAEDRFQKQNDSQRDEFARWLVDDPQMARQCQAAHDGLRELFGRTLSELTDYVDSHREELIDSEFVRSDMVDRYGALLNHVSGLYGLIKRLASAEQTMGAPPRKDS
jgi:hypothetical protein